MGSAVIEALGSRDGSTSLVCANEMYLRAHAKICDLLEPSDLLEFRPGKSGCGTAVYVRHGGGHSGEVRAIASLSSKVWSQGMNQPIGIFFADGLVILAAHVPHRHTSGTRPPRDYVDAARLWPTVMFVGDDNGLLDFEGLNLLTYTGSSGRRIACGTPIGSDLQARFDVEDLTTPQDGARLAQVSDHPGILRLRLRASRATADPRAMGQSLSVRPKQPDDEEAHHLDPGRGFSSSIRGDENAEKPDMLGERIVAQGEGPPVGTARRRGGDLSRDKGEVADLDPREFHLLDESE